MSKTTVQTLFGGAVGTGQVGAQTLNLIEVQDLGAQIQAGIGALTVDDVKASELVLTGLMPDDSGSISTSGNTEEVIEGHNLVLDALLGSKQNAQGVLVLTRYLNGLVLNPSVLLKDAVRLDTKNYNPVLGTPLYDESFVFLSTILAKTQEFLDGGVACRSVSLIISDGKDEHSPRQFGGRGTKAGDVARLVREMLKTERHIIAGFGIGGGADFREVFGEMGIRDEWILTPGSDQSAIRRAFQVFSQSAARASESAGSFSQVAVGGFTNP